MRVLMLNYEYPPIGGGAAPVTRALAEQLARGGHAVDVVTMGYGRLPFREEVCDGRLRVFRVPALRRSPVRAVTVEMASYLASALPWAGYLTTHQRYDLIHAHFLMPTGVLGAALKRLSGLPLVVTVHGSDVPGYNPDRFKRGHRLLFPAWKRLVRSADAIISPSAYLRDLLQRSLPAPVTVVPYGFSPAAPAGVARRRRILFASRLFPRKGAQFLLEALAGLELAEWEVVIAGDGPMLDPLKAQAQRLGLTVQFPGFVKGQALQELYASSAIFVFPSLHDNFPVVLLEALSHGCAVIANDCTGMPEVVGEAGLLVRPHDVDGLRAAIARLMADAALRDELGARARRRIAELSWARILDQHLELYGRVLSPGAAISAGTPSAAPRR
ncbi:MAG: glycosyltransferase family 4 protein [Chloroflexi bacterium]|nr:glycosyltransferase family 4 protein [Chloroflexota bacterium]